MFKFIALSTAAVVALSGTALAADMPGADAWGPVTTGYEGFFAGASVGYAQGTLSDRNSPQAFPDAALTGQFVGGQAGYNFVLMDNVVFGIQGDLNWAQETGTTGPTTATLHLPGGSNIVNATVSDTITWTGAVTGRVGVTNGALMLYGLGGVAAAGNSLTSTGTDGLGGNSPVEADATQTHVGWTAGAGLSALMGPVEAFLEYRYSDYGSADYTSSTGSTALDLTDQSVRVGFNYHQH